MTKTPSKRHRGGMHRQLQKANTNVDKQIWDAWGLFGLVSITCLVLNLFFNPFGLDPIFSKVLVLFLILVLVTSIGFWRLASLIFKPFFLLISLTLGFSLSTAKENYHYLIPFMPSIFSYFSKSKIVIIVWGGFFISILFFPLTPAPGYGWVLVLFASAVITLRVLSRIRMQFHGPAFFEKLADGIKSEKFLPPKNSKRNVKYLSALLFFSALFRAVSIKISERSMRAPILMFSITSFLVTCLIFIVALTIISGGIDVHFGPVFDAKLELTERKWYPYISFVISELCLTDNSLLSAAHEKGYTLALAINILGVLLFVLPRSIFYWQCIQ